MEKQSEVNRNCGIEMLKIISIFLIIISHVVMTIRLKNQFVSYDDYIFDFSYVSKGMSGIILAIFQHFGSLGNTILPKLDKVLEQYLSPIIFSVNDIICFFINIGSSLMK